MKTLDFIVQPIKTRDFTLTKTNALKQTCCPQRFWKCWTISSFDGAGADMIFWLSEDFRFQKLDFLIFFVFKVFESTFAALVLSIFI